MKLGIMQPYFFPYIGYWQLINAVDQYVIYDDVNFIKGGWINRNNILVNNTPKMISLPLAGASPNLKINEISLSFNLKQKDKFLRTIEFSYKKAPFFHEVFPLIERIILYDEINLAVYLTNSIKCICDYLKINTKIIVSSSIEKNSSLRAEEKVIHICNILGATDYYNAIGGKNLYSHKDFAKKKITLHFLQTNEIFYQQFNDAYISNLSILDILMFNSIDEVKKLLNKFELVDKDE